MDEAGNGANVNDGIPCGESYFISTQTNEKRLMKQANGRMYMTEHGISYQGVIAIRELKESSQRVDIKEIGE